MKGLTLGAFKLNADGVIVAIVAPHKRAYAGMPGSVVTRNKLKNFSVPRNEKMRGNWNDLKQDFIQLWYYKSFGFLGPRTQFVLTNSSPSLRSQFLKLPFIEYNWFLLQNNKNANILPADVQNVVKVFHLDDKRFTWKSIDPFSKAIISFVVFVSIYVWLDESGKQKTKELPAQKSTVISE